MRIRPLIFGLLAVVIGQAVAAQDEPFPRFPPRKPSEAVGTFQLLDGFQMQLLAAEPLIIDPVAGAYDEDGRLFVVEMSDYPYTDRKNDLPFQENTADPPIGRVRLLIDRDGDGRFDEAHLFAEKLSWPTGVAVWKGGVFVAATPEIWYLKDTDGDHKADIREKVFTGFRKYNVQAVMNNLQWGLDHRIYGAASGNGGLVRRADKTPKSPAINVLRRDFRFDPRSFDFEAISGGARFGNTFDDWGNRFLCDIRNPAEHVVLPSRYLERNPNLPAPRVLHDAAEAGDTIPVYRISPPEPWRELRARRWAAIGKAYPRSELVGAGYLTSSSGVTVYRGDAYPSTFRGNLFLGEVANNLVLRLAVEPDGVTFRARRAAPDGVEFLASTDTWFRPVNFVNAPDGTLHVLDMYRETIEHPWSIPDDIKARLDLRSGEDRGRLYRLTPPGFQARPTPRLSQATVAELVALLEHPNAWHRDTAHRLLFERNDVAAVPALRRLLRESASPLGRLHALWSLEGLNALDDDDLSAALGDRSSGVREHAVRLAEPRLKHDPKWLNSMLNLAADEHPRVRYQVAFTLGEVDDAHAVEGLARIALRDASDPWIRTAVLSSSSRNAGALFASLLTAMNEPPADATHRAGMVEMLRSLAFLVGAEGKPAEAIRALDSLANSPLSRSNDRETRFDLTLPIAEGLRSRGQPFFDLPMDRQKDARVVEFLERLHTDAQALVSDRSASQALRVQAITLIGFRPFDEVESLLAPLLSSNEPPEIHRASAKALASHAQPEVATILLKPYRRYAPAMKGDVLQLLLGRAIWVGPLLDAVQAGLVPVGEIPPARRGLLLSSKDAGIRARAESLFGPTSPGPRREVIERYQQALKQPSDPDRGRAVFHRECLTCHRLGETGHEVGPNLSSIRRRTADEVLIHILDPNREVAPDYLEYTVALEDGRVLSGLIEAETATSLTLKRAEGVEDSILRRNIQEIASTGKSLMPEGLESKISIQEMADLLAFLLELQK